MNVTSTDRIEKKVLLRAPRAKVWQAIADARAFGEWFGVDLDGSFAPGARLGGRITHEGYEHLPFEITVEEMEPERLFSWRWHPNAVGSGVDYDAEQSTRTRRAVFGELAETPTLLIGTHFAGASAGRVVGDGDAYRLVV